MKIEQNPFSIYDFLGYLIPGIIFVTGFLFLIDADYSKIPKFPFDMKLDQYIVVLLMCYLCGHLLSYLSSISIEFFAVWSLGFPSRYLLGYRIPGIWSNFFRVGSKNIFLIIAKILMCIYIFPVILTDLFIRKVLRTTSILGKSMDKISVKLIENRIIEYIVNELGFSNITIEDKDKEKPPDFFRFIYHYACEESKVHFGKMQNYVALYGFTRTICFTSISLLWVLIVQLAITGYEGYMCLYMIGLTIISGILYVDFNKFYRKFSLEAMMAFSILYKPKNCA